MIHACEPNPGLEKYLANQAAQAGFRYFAEAVGSDDGQSAIDHVLFLNLERKGL